MSTENREGFNSSSLDVPSKEEVKKSEAHLTSAAAFVEGGIQEACEDACSICLEEFCESDPSTVTNCKHEFHLQCILEWCQRSSECPMCLQPIGLKDPTSQELLDAVEQERNFRVNTARNATIFHHPALGDFELPHLPVGASDAELEERIIQHLAAAAAMGRARHIARREGQRNRLSSHARPQFFVLSAQSNAPVTSPASSPPAQSDEDIPAPRITLAPPSSPSIVMGEESSELNTSVASGRAHPAADIASASGVISDNHRGSPVNNRRSPGQSSPSGQDRAGPSEFQSFSESLKSRFNSMSMRCKESISKSTRGWKEKFFSRNNSMADLGSEVRREVNAGIATVSRMMERLETRDNGKPDIASASNSSGDGSVQESNDQGLAGTSNNNSPHSTNEQTSFAAGSGSS